MYGVKWETISFFKKIIFKEYDEILSWGLTWVMSFSHFAYKLLNIELQKIYDNQYLYMNIEKIIYCYATLLLPPLKNVFI